MAVGVLRDPAGRVLITRRHTESHQGGLWEFPGGKLEEGESLTAALARELFEELGVRVLEHRALVDLRHDYGDCRVRLDVHEILRYSGEPQGREGQPMRWVAAVELDGYDFPAANLPIVEALCSPKSSETVSANSPD